MRTIFTMVVAALALATFPVAAALEAHATAQVAGPSLSEVPELPKAPSAPALPAVGPPAVHLPSSLPLPSAPTSLPVDLPRAAAGDPVGVVHVDLAPTPQARAMAAAQAAGAVAVRAAPPAVATAGFLALLQALGIWRLFATGGVALYSRLTRSNLLDNGHRDAVYKLIQETPGVNVSEVAQRTGLGWGTTVYHLERLEREGFVAAERGGLHKCYFAVGHVDRDARRTAAALKDDTRRDLAAVLLAQPGITQAELASKLGMTASAASKQVTKLETAGLVRREREWKTVRLFPGPGLVAGA